MLKLHKHKILKKVLPIFLVSLSLLNLRLLYTEEILSLNSLIEEAKKNNPEILAAQSRWEAASARVGQAKSLDSPTIGFSFEKIPKGTIKLNETMSLDRKLSFAQMFPLFGKLSLKEKMALVELQMFAADYKNKELQIVNAVKNAYYDLFLNLKEIELNAKNLLFLENLAQIAQGRYIVGEIPQEDIFKITLEIAQLSNHIVNLKQETKVKEARLNILLNREPEAQLGLPQLEENFSFAKDIDSFLFMPVMQPSVSLTEAIQVIQIQDRIIESFPEVEMVVGKVGRAETATDPAPIEMFETIITLKPKSLWRKGMTKEKLIREMDAALEIPGVSNIWTQPIVNRIDMLATGIRTSVGVKVFGPDLNKIEEIAQEVEDVVKTIPGAVDLYSEKIVGKPYIEFKIDREKLARYGISIRDVQEVIEMAIGGENLTTTVEGRERYPVRVRYARELRDNIEALRRVLVSTKDGAQIPISQLADIYFVTGPAMINSENGLLRAYVLMNVRGRDMVGFVEEASQIVAEKVKLLPGYFLQWSGQFENQVRAKKKISVLLPVSLLINFMLIYMNFRSIIKSIFIFIAIPVTLAGGVWLLAFSGFNFSVAVWVGFIALFGIAVDDGVLITTYLDDVFRERRERIKTREDVIEATVHAGLGRIRPAFLTTITTIAALLPIMFLKGTGAEVMQPMAIPSIGGMAIEMITWFIVPTLYSWREEQQLSKIEK